MEVYRFFADKIVFSCLNLVRNSLKCCEITKPEEEEHKVSSNYHTQTNPLLTSFLVVFLRKNFPEILLKNRTKEVNKQF